MISLALRFIASVGPVQGRGFHVHDLGAGEGLAAVLLHMVVPVKLEKPAPGGCDGWEVRAGS